MILVSQRRKANRTEKNGQELYLKMEANSTMNHRNTSAHIWTHLVGCKELNQPDSKILWSQKNYSVVATDVEGRHGRN